MATKAEVMKKLKEAFDLLGESDFTLFIPCDFGDSFYIKPYKSARGDTEFKIVEFADGDFYLQYYGGIELKTSIEAFNEIRDSQIKLYGKAED
jgi:hypothetical protein